MSETPNLTRDEIKDARAFLYQDYGGNKWPWRWKMADALCDAALRAEALEKSLAAMRWIPVTERLPDVREGNVLVAWSSRRRNVETMQAGHVESLKDQGDGWPHITHWMPLPALPDELTKGGA